MRNREVGESTTYLLKPGKLKPKESYKIIRTNQTSADENDKASAYHITFRITEACDLKCDYCDWNIGKHYKFDDIIKSIDVLFEFFKKERIKRVKFYYHGGEATRHPKVVHILKYIHEKGAEANITVLNEMQTNLTVRNEKLQAILEHTDLLDITFHYNELVKKNKIGAFITNYNYLVKNNIKINNLDIMLEYIKDAENLQAFRKYVTKFLSYKNIFNSEMIYDFGYEYNFNNETETMHYDFYKEHNKSEQLYEIDGKTYTTNDLFQRGADFTGWWCAAGVNILYVNGNGNTYQCGIAMTSDLHNKNGGIYTQLVHDKMALTKLSILRKTGTICKWNYCGGDFYFDRHKLQEGKK